MNLSTPEIIVIAIAVVAVLLIVAAIVAFVRRKKRREHLKERFGRDEYARAVDRAGSERRAEGQLTQREERRETFEVRDLSSGERSTFRGRFEALEASFVESPESAVRAADELLDEVAECRGYPEAGADQRLEDLSVDHPASADRYRTSRPRADREGASPTTEQYRQALIGSRALFEALVGRDSAAGTDAPPTFQDLVAEDERGEHADNGHRRRESTRH